MSTNNISILNAQFTLYYLLVATDGKVSENEKTLFLNVVSKVGGFTRSYAESVFNAMHRFAKTLNYKFNIEILKSATIEVKVETINLLRELAYADGKFRPTETNFILRVEKDLGLL